MATTLGEFYRGLELAGDALATRALGEDPNGDRSEFILLLRNIPEVATVAVAKP